MHHGPLELCLYIIILSALQHERLSQMTYKKESSCCCCVAWSCRCLLVCYHPPAKRGKEREGEGRRRGERGGEEGSQTKSRGTSRKHIGTKLRHGGASIARRPGRRWRSSGAPTLRVLMFGRAAAGHPARGIRRRGRRRALLELWVNRARCQRAKRTRWTLRGPNLEGI